MARIFITGSSDGLGLLAAEKLIENGHSVVLHARNSQRAKEAWQKVPNAEDILIADLSSIEETKKLAGDVNKSGSFDAVIHNAGIYNESEDMFAVNTLAPYILTSIINKPQRLIYLSSGLHLQGNPKLESFLNEPSKITYSDTKLHVLMLSLIVAKKWNDIFSNAVNPGWVPTKMGGKNATDDLQKGYETQVWLAESADNEAKVSGKYFYHKRQASINPKALDEVSQDRFIELCREITGVPFGKQTQ